MFRMRQQHWFGLAAICLVGSLLGLWSTDLPVAKEPAEISQALHEPPLLRHFDHRAVTGEFGGASVSSGNDTSREMLIQAPAGIPGRMASPLNTSGRILTRRRVAPAGFQSVVSVPEPVWLSGQIEPVEIALRDGAPPAVSR